MEAHHVVWPRNRDLVPSVFVLFLRLSEEDDELLDKAKDEELVKELVARKKVLSERGIKLTVVLIASRELLGEITDPWSSHSSRFACPTLTINLASFFS